MSRKSEVNEVLIIKIQHTVAERTRDSTEVLFTNANINSPPGGRINYTTTPPTSASNRLCIFDTGRAATPYGTNTLATHEGLKLICMNLSNNTILKIIIFGPTAAPADFYLNFGAYGIAISADGATLYRAVTSGRSLYSIPAAHLLDNSPCSKIMAQGSVLLHGHKGLSNGMESNTNNDMYAGNTEDKSNLIFHLDTGIVTTFVRDPRFD
ncbi:hypothetical protein MMC12_003092 [Toensbergia leucococca]|nr:hypothetical protein [Toensbergia leucococca]